MFVFITELVIAFAKDELADWLTTIAATAIGALLALVAGLNQFGYQQRETARLRREQLGSLVRAELEDTADELESKNANRTPEKGDTTLIYIQPLVLEQAIQSGLFSPSLTRELLGVVRQFHTYNTKVAGMVALGPGYGTTPAEYQQVRSRQRGVAG